jgi:hypothetical protein
MALKFSLKPKEKNIRILSAPGVVWKVVPMTSSEDAELVKKFQEYDTRARAYLVSDDMGLLKARAIQIIRGWEGLPGDETDADGKPMMIPYTTSNLEALCEMATPVISEVILESRRADALVVEAAEKNS